ncbi:MAG: hypothetical protein HY360_12735 [Verrucomicrobia bacterium]|nr:hypothetical protein [Verrucomicrobiota bacterium]
MDQTPDIDSIEERKHAALQRLERCREETMACWKDLESRYTQMEVRWQETVSHYQQVTTTIRNANRRIISLTSHPLIPWIVAGGIGYLIFSGRLRLVGKTLGLAIPMIVPRLREFLLRYIWNWMLRRLPLIGSRS